uniref:SEC14 like lipid binding 2 n=1 Tax=Equus caballus TaxID=9796 RepID=A0A9L0S5U7_HORSE
MSGRVGDLSPKQKEALAKFRENVQDVLPALPNPDDYFLLRWLRGDPAVSVRGHVWLRPGWLPRLVRYHWTAGYQGSAPLSQQTGLAQDQDAGL